MTAVYKARLENWKRELTSELVRNGGWKWCGTQS